MHTTGDHDLAVLLQKEIKGEQQSLIPDLPSKFEGFSVKANQAQLIFTKKHDDEIITITLDVNHSVDADSEAQESEHEYEAELKSRPSFEVDVAVQSRVLSFTCSLLGAEQSDAGNPDIVSDVFGINEITLYDGEWKEEMYCVSGDILDQELYENFLAFLAQRGITEKFAENLSKLCTSYEHSLYVGFLENVLSFVLRK
jgi:complement component 1 Q subcomponent-binding protein